MGSVFASVVQGVGAELGMLFGIITVLSHLIFLASVLRHAPALGTDSSTETA